MGADEFTRATKLMYFRQKYSRIFLNSDAQSNAYRTKNAGDLK